MTSLPPKIKISQASFTYHISYLPHPSRLWRPLATLFLSLLLAACATKKDSAPPPDPSDTLDAVFVEKSATKPLPNPLTAFSRLLPQKKSPPAPLASPVDWAGEIRMVNIAESFVLVESRSAANAIPGEKHTAIRDGRETGVVRMTPLRNPPFLIADIVSGNPSPGDKIHLPRPSSPLAAPDFAKPSAPSPFARLAGLLREILPSRRPKP